MTKKKRTLKGCLTNVLIFMVTLIVLLYAVSAGFRYFKGDEAWTAEAQAYNDSINAFNDSISFLHPYLFTDIIREKEKPKGVFRIAVLGDSFIFGDGIPYYQTWSHLLENSVAELYDSVEVMSWGQRGWATLDEFEYIKEHGINYQPDLIIFGFVDNDPDLRLFTQEEPGFAGWFSRQSYMPSIVLNIVNKLVGKSYKNWMDRLYSDENMHAYTDLWVEVDQYTKDNNLEFMVAMTHSNYYESNEQSFKTMEKVFDELGISYINLLEKGKPLHKDLPDTELQANQVNGHPGLMMNEFFAKEVMSYLTEKGYLDSVK